MEYSINSEFLYDRGNGFEKGRVLQATVCKNGEKWHLTMDMKSALESCILCWRPFEFPVLIEDIEVQGAEIIEHNAHKTSGNNYTFILGDGYFYLSPIEGAQQLSIKCAAHKLLICEQRALLRDDSIAYDELQYEIKQLNAKNERLTQDLDSVLNSTIWRKTEPLRRWKDKQIVEKQDIEQSTGIVRPYDDNTSIEELLYSSIDVVEIKDNILTIEGWVICIEHEIVDVRLILEDGFGVKHSCPLELKGRKDVADTLGVRCIGDCGINFCADYESYSAQKILLEVLINGTWYIVDTQKSIPASKCSQGGMFFMEPYCDSEPPLDYWRFCQEYLEDSAKAISPNENWKADIIVPVYNGMEYLPELFRGIESTGIAYRLIVIDDCSSDQRLYPYLQTYADAHDNVVLLRNEENQGFVKTVNRALKMTDSHVVLVNTDVRLPDKWLERILAPLYLKEGVASVTPFSNSATIYSFPNMCEDNELFMGLGVDEIDHIFSKIRQRNISAPTGVGFCMALNQEVIKEVGILDDNTFEKGYGEENDWCQRAIRAGYENVCAENLFVFHNHGGSFASEEKKRLMEQNSIRLQEKHPDYYLDVEDYCKMDPNRDIRMYVKFELMLQSDRPMILAFDHDLGGGASAYLDNSLANEWKQGNMTAVVRYNKVADRYTLRLSDQNYHVQIVAKKRQEIVNLLKKRKYAQIWINELATYNELAQWLADIIYLRNNQACLLKMLVHDYFSVCPSLNLVNSMCKYCGVPKEQEICAECLKNNQYVYNDECQDIDKWRKDWLTLLRVCDIVVVFSNDSEKRLKAIYPQIDSIELIPHEIVPLCVVEKKKTTETINIGILGTISNQKGLGLLKEMVAYLNENSMKLHLVVIGDTAEEVHSSFLTVTGQYQREDIPDLVKEHDVDVFFIPSVWPETFSFTTAEVMSMEMPLAVFNIGAPAERVRDYPKGLIIEDMNIKCEELLKQLYEFGKRHELE